MNPAEILRSLARETPDEDRVDFVKGVVFQLYTQILADERSKDFTMTAVSDAGEPVAVLVRPFVERVDLIAALVKTLYGRKTQANDLLVSPCRTEDVAGSGYGLTLFVGDQPVLVIGPLHDGTGMFVRQLAPERNAPVRQTPVPDAGLRARIRSPLTPRTANPVKQK